MDFIKRSFGLDSSLQVIVSSVIRQKGKSQSECFKKTKHVTFFQKRTFSNPLICTRSCVYQGVRNVRFSENLTCFVFLKHPLWDSPLCLITDALSLFCKWLTVATDGTVGALMIMNVWTICYALYWANNTVILIYMANIHSLLLIQLLKVPESPGCNFPSAQRLNIESAPISVDAAVFCLFLC